MSRYYRENPEEPVRHDWVTPGKPSTMSTDSKQPEASDKLPAPPSTIAAFLSHLREQESKSTNGQWVSVASEDFHRVMAKRANGLAFEMVATELGRPDAVFIASAKRYHRKLLDVAAIAAEYHEDCRQHAGYLANPSRVGHCPMCEAIQSLLEEGKGQ